jgi:hypothetical protein
VATAATANYLIESVGPAVNLCKLTGDAWVTVHRGITEDDARGYGFNLDAPAVQRVFEAARVANPTYTPTVGEAMRNPKEFVDGMDEV